MMSREDAREMAKYIAMGVSHPSNNTSEKKIDVTLDILERYNVVEKEKDMVFGHQNNDTFSIEEDEREM